MKSSADPIVYQASRTMVALVTGAFAVLAGFAVVAFLTRAFGKGTVLVGAVAVVVGLAAVIEVRIGRIVLQSDSLLITHWFRTRRIAIEDIEAVSLEGGRTSIRLKASGWMRLPEWIGVNRSLGRRLRDRIAASSLKE